MGKLIVALDLDEKRKIFDLIEILGDRVDFYKVGWISYLICGDEIIKRLKKNNKKVFIDFKFFDIPNTVKNAVKIICKNGVDMFTFHLMAGKEVMKNIVEIKNQIGSSTKAIGVSVLTSFTEQDIKFLEINLSIKELVRKLVNLGYQSGIDGIICSGEELEELRRSFPSPFLLITPGVRISEKKDDQKRVITPKDAIMKGADYIVVGRPIYDSPKPDIVVEKILKDIEQ
ncbi:MAG: orotidine-5'-phosphate decarboxylase [Candidatus Omnitrophica bacterium]|nr:orotidine-5'-phosphate decarboxylase [Candidatus Omnitrophota bacterium]